MDLDVVNTIFFIFYVLKISLYEWQNYPVSKKYSGHLNIKS